MTNTNKTTKCVIILKSFTKILQSFFFLTVTEKLISYYPRWFLSGEICAFKIFGQDAPFEAVVLNRTSGEGVLRASSHVDCESQKEYTFIIQAYDCGAGPNGADWKKSHK